jgi:hypothetical protein
MSSNSSSSSAWPRCALVACLAFPIMAIACGTQSSETEGSSPSTIDASRPATPSTQARLSAVSRAPQAARALIRASASGSSSYEIEVQSPTGFSPKAFDPVLRIGGKEFSRSRESKSVGEYGAIFSVEKADFDALADASDISVGYGRKFARPVKLGRLDKRSLAVR